MARNFVDLIRGGFERGLGEARDILSGLGVLGADSPTEQGFNQTYALVMKGYEDFLAATRHKHSPGLAKEGDLTEIAITVVAACAYSIRATGLFCFEVARCGRNALLCTV